jgi:hypothetical protein
MVPVTARVDVKKPCTAPMSFGGAMSPAMVIATTSIQPTQRPVRVAN